MGLFSPPVTSIPVRRGADPLSARRSALPDRRRSRCSSPGPPDARGTAANRQAPHLKAAASRDLNARRDRPAGRVHPGGSARKAAEAKSPVSSCSTASEAGKPRRHTYPRCRSARLPRCRIPDLPGSASGENQPAVVTGVPALTGSVDVTEAKQQPALGYLRPEALPAARIAPTCTVMRTTSTAGRKRSGTPVPRSCVARSSAKTPAYRP